MSDLLVFAVPSQTVRANARNVRDAYADGTVVVSGVKGLELETGQRMSEVIAEELGGRCGDRVVVLSGPNLSREVAGGLPASTVVACADLTSARKVRSAFMSPTFRVYSHTDVIGVELGGALKNIIAIGAGMGDGLGYGANAKAAFLTRGLMEISRLGAALGANPATFSGLAGMGDLVATCISDLSRNRRLGEAIARGESMKSARERMHEVAEGVETTSVALLLAQRTGTDMPITEMTSRVLFGGLDPQTAVEQLMTRDAKEETLAGP
jgi:glycerol-3-phosphate dehydrogenase (NAD(P)+)